MKKIMILAACLSAMLTAAADGTPLWMRFPAISPDGQTIVFSYQGDLFSVPTAGGAARQLTTNSAYDAYPVWSPDGSQIAFASTREGSMDVYVVGRDGGVPRRLTTHSAAETPMAWSDKNHVLYSCNLMPTAQSTIFAQADFPQVYEVSTEGGRPKLFSTITLEDVSLNQQGDLLYHDKKGYEDAFRKHHQSSICRDIWLRSNGQFTKLTTFRGEDRTPRWAPDGKSFYYLSEQDGTFNVWKRSLDGSSQQQLTHHQKNPVRFLTVASNGTLCYGFDGEIYTWSDGREQKVNISIITDRQDRDLERRLMTRGATEIKLSPKNKEIAFVMHGDVYVTSTDYKTTRQITNTPEQERSIDFSPDGRSLVYGSERGGHWQLYRTSIKKSEEKQFAYATELTEERLTQSDITSMQPKFSPDGSQVAFFEDRGALRVIQLDTRQVRTVLDAKYNFSYSDGDLDFEWSPDSRWLLATYIGTGGWNNSDIALVDARGERAPYNLTNSGYNDSGAKWALGGRAMLFESDRAGYRSHGSWGAETDVYLMFFDLDAYNRFRMTKEEKALNDEAEKEARKKEAEAAKNSKKKKGDKQKAEKSGQFSLSAAQLEEARDRIVRLTVNSSHLGDYVLSPRGDTLYYQSSFEGEADLWKHDFLEEKTELVLKGIGRGGMEADGNFKKLYVCGQGGIKKVDLAKNKSENVDFEAPFNYRPYKERQYLFDHIWQQVKDKFYDPQLHGVDWEAYREVYRRFLPHINNKYDFRDMLSEMLGELNASHTGARYRPENAAPATARLGVFLDHNYDGDGLRIAETIRRSPLAVKDIASGSIIEQIDGTTIKRGMDYNYLLDGKVGKPVRLTIRAQGATTTNDVTIRPLSQAQLEELLYKRWVDHNRHLVDSLSCGRLAYVHVKAMNSPSFRQVYSDLLSDQNRNRDAVIVDERYNGGGWLHDDLCTLLSGRQYQSFVPHGKYVGYDPYNKWVKPSCVLMCEDDYSNGHGFPWVYRELGIGKLIGTPVAGTMTAVWWETLMDPTLVFGIPQVGCRDVRGKYCENNELFPDIEVYNTPEDYINGRDRQLETAVKEMLKQVQVKGKDM